MQPTTLRSIAGFMKKFLEVVAFLCTLVAISLPWYYLTSSEEGGTKTVHIQSLYYYTSTSCNEDYAYADYKACEDIATGVTIWQLGSDYTYERLLYAGTWGAGVIAFVLQLISLAVPRQSSMSLYMTLLSTLLLTASFLAFRLLLVMAVGSDNVQCSVDSATPCNTFRGDTTTPFYVTSATGNSLVAVLAWGGSLGFYFAVVAAVVEFASTWFTLYLKLTKRKSKKKQMIIRDAFTFDAYGTMDSSGPSVSKELSAKELLSMDEEQISLLMTDGETSSGSLQFSSSSTMDDVAASPPTSSDASAPPSVVLRQKGFRPIQVD
mmetsp:Transcript_9481/g.38746  ORF Transcript_9481/g.38746 Transcript_9481/m.38746 type:complete len:321 (-) Transcript_9481:58-1020(-)